MVRSLFVGSMLSMALGATASLADTVTLNCSGTGSGGNQYTISLTIDSAASTVTDDEGTWQAQITDQQVIWTSIYPRTNAAHPNYYHRATAEWTGEFGTRECVKATPQPF